MEFTRNLKRYMIGADVRAVKDRLVELGYLAKATHNMFADDTRKAVMAFQSANSLECDGIVGILTWTALFSGQPQPVPSVDVPDWIAEPARTQISQALAGVSVVRREICLTALKYCVDRNKNPNLLKGFYIRGGNLFNKDLSLNVMTAAKLASYFKRSAYAPYYDSGRREMMLRMAQQTGYTIVGADCSGMIVGLWRKAGVVRNDFDAAANTLYGSYCVERKAANILPGDLAWKSGHIGLCVSKDWIVEDGGGAYGIQLTKRTDRRLKDFRDGSVYKPGKWTKYGDPKMY